MFTITGDIDVNVFNQVLAYIDASVRIPDWVPVIGGDPLFSVEGLLYVDPVVPDNDLLAAWIDWDLLFAHLRAGLEAKFHGTDAGLHFLWGDQVEQLENLATQGDQGYTTSFTPTISADANQSLFTYEWDGTNEVGEVTFTIPGAAAPVVLTLGDTAAHSVVINNFDLLRAAERGGDPGEPLRLGLHRGADESVRRPPVRAVHGQRAHGRAGDRQAEPQGDPHAPHGQLGGADPAPREQHRRGRRDVRHRRPELDDHRALLQQGRHVGTGTRFDSFSLSGMANAGTVRRTFNLNTDPTLSSIPLQVWKLGYHVYARINDGTTGNSPSSGGSGGTGPWLGASPVSPSPVSPYVDLFVQVQVTPDLPVDQKPALAGWKVLWQEVDGTGKTVGEPFQRVTDRFGQAGITAGVGKLWDVTVTPANIDGFRPIAAAGQVANPNGYLTAPGVGGGTYANPNQITMSFQNTVSIHGTVARDLSGTGVFTPGAGLSGYIVYSDLDGDGKLDPAEPHTQTGLGGGFDLRFPVPAATTSYTLRLLPNTGDTTTFVQPNPDQPGVAFTPARRIRST